jgi:hypothetical protein
VDSGSELVAVMRAVYERGSGVRKRVTPRSHGD